MHNRKNTWFHKALTVFILVAGAPLVAVIIFLVIVNDLLFGTYTGWNYNYNIFTKVFRVGYFLTGLKVQEQYETPHNRKQKYVFVFNHISYLDIPIMMTALHQPVRVLAKTGPDKIPIFGYYYKHSTVMVDRTSLASRSRSVNNLKHFLDKGISILIFPEGTFNQQHTPLKDFYDGAFRIAIETQTNIKPVIMPDNYERLYYYGLSLEPGVSRVIYLEEVNVQGLTMNDLETLKKTVYHQMADALQRYQASWIATETGNRSAAPAL
ncbi:MAG: 1-acyl-sn-glycerol-3-phosphate acyltransferase [Dinghuibacter sp.]|nr:1-acyl-sn-glycerol-3-phosphate acyltransferase [Dinghuibacter sp.]